MRPSYLLPILFGILLSTGCIQEDFYQKVGKDGRSVLSVQYDFSQALSMLNQYGSQYGAPGGINESDFTLQLQKSCSQAMQKNAALRCNVSGSRMSMSLPIDANNPYYTFEAKDAIPYRTYKVILKRIPLDKLAPVFNTTNSSGFDQTPSALDLTNKTANARTAQGISLLQGFRFSYSVEMPGDIQSAMAGSYAGTIGNDRPNVATFDMVKVLSDSAPLVVESRELNLLPIVAAAALILLVLVAILFFVGARKH